MEQPDSEASRSPNHQANSIFLRLPRELRLSIYEQLLGSIEPGCKLHITENDITHKLSSVLCTAPPEDSPGIQHRPTSHAQRRWQSIHSGCRLEIFIRSWETPQTFVSAIGKNTTVKSLLDIFRNLLLTCKQIYLEVNSILYSRFTFVLSGLDPMQRFLSIGPQSLEHIRNLDIMWAPQIHSPDPSKKKADALDIQSKWMVICGAIKNMRNLKHARIHVYTLWEGRMTEREFLAPLSQSVTSISIAQHDIILELPRHLDNNQDEDLMGNHSSEGGLFTIVRT